MSDTGPAGPGSDSPNSALSGQARKRFWLNRRQAAQGETAFGLTLVGDQPEALDARMPPTWAWVSAHGGAGTTTLALAAGAGVEATALHRDQRLIAPLPVVVVARTSAHGLTQAQQMAARGVGPGGFVVHQRATTLMGLVLVHDAPGRLPKPLAELKHLVSGAYLNAWEVPWVEAWRLGDPPDAANTPKDVRRLVKDLRSLTLGSAIDLRSRLDHVSGLQQYQHNYQ